MSREEKLAKSTIIYFIGVFGSKLLSFILLPVYSNYLTQSAYGNYDLIHTIIQIAYPAITLMLDNAMYVYLIGTNDVKEKQNIIFFAIRTMIINSGLATIIVLVVNYFTPIRYVAWIIAWLLSYSAYNMWMQICRGFGQQKLYSLTGVIVTAITLFGNILGLVVLKQDYKFLMISNFAAYTVSILFLESQLHVFRFFGRGRATKSLKRQLLTYTIPLLPNQLSWWIINVSDRLMIVYFLGTEANGVYAMACKIPAILSVVHSIFDGAWADDILTSADMKETEKYAEKIYNLYIRALIGISVVLISTNRFLFEYIISGNFIVAYKYTYFLYLGSIFSALGGCLGVFYGYYKKSLNVSISTIAAAIVNCVINLIFLKRYGIQVASISTFVGSVTIWLVRFLGLKRMVKLRITNINKLMFLILIPLYFTYKIEGFTQNVIFILIGVAIAVVINFNTIVSISTKTLKVIKRKRTVK